MSGYLNMSPPSLTSVLRRHRGPARNNHYKIILPFLDRRISPSELNALCRSCNIPSQTIQTLERKIDGTPTESAGGSDFGDLTLSFTEVTSGAVLNYFEVWMGFISPASELSAYKKEFAKDILIYRLTHAGLPAVEFKLRDCWPKTRPEIEFSDESNDQVQKITVGLSCKSYDYKVLI